jgi:hypothetical protein
MIVKRPVKLPTMGREESKNGLNNDEVSAFQRSSALCTITGTVACVISFCSFS